MWRAGLRRLALVGALAALPLGSLPASALAAPAAQAEPTRTATPTPPAAPTALLPTATVPAQGVVGAEAGAPLPLIPLTTSDSAVPAAPAAAPQSDVLRPGDTPAGLGRVLYADDFASASSGWPLQSSDPATRRVGYADGEYYIVRRAGSGGSPYVTRAERFGDFRLEIDARLEEPTTDAYVFVEFRRQDRGERYAFVVAPDEGAFTLRRNTEREGTALLDWTRAAAIQGGTEWNRLGVQAQGAEIVLLVNGEEVGRTRDEVLREGALAFGVGSLEDGPAEGRFRRLLVTSVE
jgi:hypothetical protein